MQMNLVPGSLVEGEELELLKRSPGEDASEFLCVAEQARPTSGQAARPPLIRMRFNHP